MGCCSAMCYGPDRLMDMQVSNEIAEDRGTDIRIPKLLFLGSGGSGKSTFFKQLRCIHGAGFDEIDRKVFKEHISAQIIDQMTRCIECIEYHNEKPHFERLQLSTEGEESAKYMEGIEPECIVDDEIGQHIKVLWNENAIQQIYNFRAIYHIDDSSSYFFESMDRISDKEHYLPSNLDILYVRYRTTGVIEAKFEIGTTEFHIFDVGGQQSERKKWIHCFENVTAVIFVASLSCYDELMFEDDSINCMIDALELFKEICTLQWFVTTPIILFLNKKDLFETKIQSISLSACFKEYKEKPPRSPYEEKEDGTLLKEEKDEYMIASRDYIKQQFLTLDNNTQTRQIYAHITCATDKNNVQMVFDDVEQIVISLIFNTLKSLKLT